MQSFETEDINNKDKEDDDHALTFRPSPNFKHMKKYLKSKFEVEEMSGNQNVEDSLSKITGENKENNGNTMVQPPLPPNSPPPEGPIVFKREEEDEEYIDGGGENANNEPKNDENKTQKIMCRRFARGMCDKGAACIYEHEIILSQLPGVYTFCKNFQNVGCKLPKCKFVHATVFEKESYFRTGYLPPHALAHLSPSAPQNFASSAVPSMFKTPPPVIPNAKYKKVASMPVLGCAPPPSLENRTPNDVLGNSLSISPLKRPRSEIEEFNSITSRDLDVSAPLIKKCKNCDINEFRLQCHKNKVKKLMRSSEEMSKKQALLAKKTEKLYTVLSLLKISNNGMGVNTSLLNNLPVNLRPEQKKTKMDQMNLFFSSNNSVSLNGDDKNITSTSNFTSVLLKLLLNSNQSMSSDST